MYQNDVYMSETWKEAAQSSSLQRAGQFRKERLEEEEEIYKIVIIKEKKGTYSVRTRVDYYISKIFGRWDNLTNCTIQSKYINIFTFRVLHEVLGTDPKPVLSDLKPEPKSSKSYKV